MRWPPRRTDRSRSSRRSSDRTADLLRRPSDAKWSATGHLAHLCLVNEPYLETIESAVRTARAAGNHLGDGPYRHPWFATWFVRSMEPPPKRRLKTMRAMTPEPSVDSGHTLDRFRAAQERLAVALEEARGLDLGRIRFSSPFLRLVRLSLGSALELLLAHNRRHIWLIRETLGLPSVTGAD